MVENLWAVQAPPRNPPGELTALPRPPGWWGGGGACCPLPKNPTPLSAFGPDFWPFGLPPQWKIVGTPGHALDALPRQAACVRIGSADESVLRSIGLLRLRRWRFDCNSTALRPFDDLTLRRVLCVVRATVLRPK